VKKRIKRIISMFAIAAAMLSMLSVNVMATGTELEGANERYTPVDTYTYNYGGHNFKQINLEDASCLDAAVAKRIRAILLNSYPNVAVETIGQQTGIVDLTVEEIVSATKIALSQYQSPESFDIHYTYDDSISALVDDYIACWYMELSEDEPDAEAQAEGAQEEEETPGEGETPGEEETPGEDETPGEGEPSETELCGELPDENAKIKAIKERLGVVINHFLGLEEVQANNHFVSAASFVDYSQAPIFTKNEDNTYNVAVNVIVSVVKQETDTMTLSAVMGDGTYFSQAGLVNGENTISLVLNNIPAELAYTEIKLAIDGVQTANTDAFMFVPKDSEEMPKPFVAIGSGQVPAHAEVTLIPPMEIGLTKSAMIKEQGADGQITEKAALLEGITFDIYRLKDETPELSYGDVDWATANYKEYVVSETAVATITTDAAGDGYCNLTALGQQPGNFLVVERSHPALTSPAVPVMVTLPFATDNGNVYKKDLVYVNSIKPEIYTAPQIRKDITNIENDLDSFAIGELHTWIIRSDIPVDIAVGKEYVITDTLDYRLSYAGDANVEVKIGTRNSGVGTEIYTLNRDEHYTLASLQKDVAIDDARTESVTAFEVRLTPAGMYAIAGIVGDNVFSDYEVRVYFKAVMDEDATPGSMIPNQALLYYTNYVNYRLEAFSDAPQVYTCSLTVYKHDAINDQVPLSGANFRLVRVATESDSPEMIKPLVVDGNTINVVYESFYTKPELTADDYAAGKSSIVSTDEAGLAYFYGLAEGNYYLVEAGAPGGYQLLSEPIPVSVSAGVERQIPCLVKYVAGSSNFELPPAGGIGTMIFTVGGGVLIGVAVVILILNNKKKDTEDEEE